MQLLFPLFLNFAILFSLKSWGPEHILVLSSAICCLHALLLGAWKATSLFFLKFLKKPLDMLKLVYKSFDC